MIARDERAIWSTICMSAASRSTGRPPCRPCLEPLSAISTRPERQRTRCVFVEGHCTVTSWATSRAFDPTVTVTPDAEPHTPAPVRHREGRPSAFPRTASAHQEPEGPPSRSTLPRDARDVGERVLTDAGGEDQDQQPRVAVGVLQRQVDRPTRSPRSVASSRICMINSRARSPADGQVGSGRPSRASPARRKRSRPPVDAAAEHGVRRGDLADPHPLDLQLTRGHLKGRGGVAVRFRSRAPAPTGTPFQHNSPSSATTPTRSPDRNPCQSGRSAFQAA